MRIGLKIILVKEKHKVKILSIIPSGFCFGLQHLTIDLFFRCKSTLDSHFLISRWGNGEIELLLTKNCIGYSYSWLGMFSRKLDNHNLKMSLYALVKLPILYLDFFRLNRRLKPDVLYFANHHELILLLPILIFSRRKIVCHMHDPAPAISFQKLSFKIYSKVVDHFIAISESVRLRTIALGCPIEKITTIYNGVYIPPFISEPRKNGFCKIANWDDKVFIIGITGQMTKNKGHEDLIRAFKLVHDNNPKVRLLIGGKQKEPFFGELVSLIKSLDLNPYVYFTGWLSEVSSFFQNIDVFVLGSRHDEGYGLVVAEAMAYTLPVVITNSGGAVEIVQDNETGFIVQKQDVNAMAEKLITLAGNPEMCRSFGLAGRSRLQDNFNIESQAMKFSTFFSTKND